MSPRVTRAWNLFGLTCDGPFGALDLRRVLRIDTEDRLWVVEGADQRQALP